MSEPDKPNPIDDLRKGLGLLFRAARTTLEKLPTGPLEEVVVNGAREVGRALENVTHTVEEQLRKSHGPSASKPGGERPPAGEAIPSDAPAAGVEPGETVRSSGDPAPEGAPGGNDKTRVG